MISLHINAFAMKNPHFLWFLMLLFMSFYVSQSTGFNSSAAKADVGVILDLDTPLGKVCRTCISMAVEDFYANRNHTTMIVPHFRDSKGDVIPTAYEGT